jgi:hypothetical protein
VWFVPNNRSTSILQGLGLSQICLWLNVHNEFEKKPNPIICDRRKIHHDIKDYKAIFSCVIFIYKAPPILERKVVEEKG